ncbi:MAG: riboflavin synthase [Asticcacaulis sp.]
MFTGIITDVGTLRDAEVTPGGMAFRVTCGYDLAGLAIGASVAHAGCCLTVIEKDDAGYKVEVSNETLSKTTLGQWRDGDRVNLERALKIGDELGGHIVSGHVDGVGHVVSVEGDGDSWRVQIRAPRPLHRYIAPKGSITVDGVSLTVNEVLDDVFGVNLIPHTWTVTTLNRLKAGDPVNLEIDMLARYAARWRETAGQTGGVSGHD